MEVSDRTRILCRMDFLARYTISLDRLTTLLVSEGALLITEKNELLSHSSDYRRCSYLYEKIIHKGPKAFEILLKCLRKSGNDHIADTLLENLSTKEAEEHKEILEGDLEKWSWSGFINEETYPVRILSWDSSNGIAAAYHDGKLWVKSWLFPLGLIFNRDGLRDLPRRLHHSGLWLHDKVYEYEANSGLRRLNSMYPGFKVISKQNTRKTARELEDWLDIQELYFSKDNYDLVTNNSLRLTKAACEFLEISFPVELQEMQDFVQHNPRSTKFFLYRSISGVGRKDQMALSQAEEEG